VTFTCCIVGSGPLEAALRDQVARLGIGDYVEVTGETAMQEDLPGLLRSARVFALPCVRDRDGDMDGLPQVLIEAMMVARPCVSTDLVGIPDLVIDGRTGLLVQPGDPHSLSDAIEVLLRDPAEADRLGREAERWARAHFTLVEAVARLRALFGEALAEPGTAPPAIRLEPASANADPGTRLASGPVPGKARPSDLPPACVSLPLREVIG
jgi:colanic acid/amylovoran biosynthesis glycosyltransferase